MLGQLEGWRCGSVKQRFSFWFLHGVCVCARARACMWMCTHGCIFKHDVYLSFWWEDFWVKLKHLRETSTPFAGHILQGRVCGLTCSSSSQCELHLISFRRKATPWESVCVCIHVRACAVIMSCLEHCHSLCLLGVRQTGREFWLQDRGVQSSCLQLHGSWLGPQSGVSQWPACLVTKAEGKVRDDECKKHFVHRSSSPWPRGEMTLVLLFVSAPVTGMTSVVQIDGEVEKEWCGKARSCFLLSSSA